MLLVDVGRLQQRLPLLVRLRRGPALVHLDVELRGGGSGEPTVGLEDRGLVSSQLEVNLLEQLVLHKVGGHGLHL